MSLNGNLGAVSFWANQWFISLNESKTESMVCTRVQHEEGHVFLKGAPVVQSNHHKHLGVTITFYLVMALGTNILNIFTCAPKP